MEHVTIYPLTWPPGTERTPAGARSRSRFANREPDAALRSLEHELDNLGVGEAVISSNLERGASGRILSARKVTGGDPGVACWFILAGDLRCIACDSYLSVAENARAIELTISSIRAMDRWGIRNMIQRMFAGFAALPAAAQPGNHWAVLGLEPGATGEEIVRRYRELAKQAHPDTGGTSPEFLALQEAYSAALHEIERGPA